VAAKRPVLHWFLTALVAMTLAAGCADVPTSGLLQHTARPAGAGGEQQGTDCCGYIMTGPGPGSSPSNIVQGFLLASADFGNHHEIARQYLTRAASRAWQPGPGPAVTVIAGAPTVTPARPPFGSRNTAVVEISAQQLGNVSASGQYIPAQAGQRPLNQEFTLQRVHNQWRIATLPAPAGTKVAPASVDQPSHELLLTKDLFQLAFQPRNLYYYLDPGGKDLVPNPVFVPVDSGDPAVDLVRALLIPPQGWLAGAVLSAFPPAATLRQPVEILPGSKTAVVDLGLPRSATSETSLAGMASQLVWTLTSSSYGSASLQAVKLEVNGKVWTPPGATSAVLSPRTFPQPALVPPRPEDLYFLGSNGAARVLGAQDGTSGAVQGQAGTGQVPLTSIAVSRDQRYLAGIGGPAGSTLYTSSLAAAAKPHASSAARALQIRMSGVSLASLSWDRNDNLWAAGSSGGKPRVWMLGPSKGTPVSVTLPPRIRSVTALRVAPDGVRVAMIASVRTVNGPETEVLLAAIVIVKTNDQVLLASGGQVGAELTQPRALSWYDADHLLVVNQASYGPQLEEVPVDGDRSSYQGIEPEMTSIAAAGPHNGLFVGLQTGHLARSVGLGELWSQFAEGHAATYPG
jgi:Lipoprotein LpqB beta-propeller domain/Sporulation and spore germination